MAQVPRAGWHEPRGGLIFLCFLAEPQFLRVDGVKRHRAYLHIPRILCAVGDVCLMTRSEISARPRMAAFEPDLEAPKA